MRRFVPYRLGKFYYQSTKGVEYEKNSGFICYGNRIVFCN